MDPKSRVERLSSLLELSSLLNSQLELGPLLQTVVDTARAFCQARLSGLLLLSEDDPTQFSGLWVSGWSTPPRHFPTGEGLYNLPIRTGKPLRVDHLPDYPGAVGTPNGHPPIGPFLGVPLKIHGKILGTLFVANFPGGRKFTEEDEELLMAFAAHAAVAAHNARLYRKVEELATLRERERLAMDLHDSLAQIFFSIGMELERLEEFVAAEGRERLAYLRSLVARGTARVRRAISELYEQGSLPGDANLYRRCAALVEEFRQEYRIQVGLVVTGDVHRVPRSYHEVFCRALREALINVHKHARADMVVVNLAVEPDCVRLIVQDNGVGLAPGALDGAPDVRRFGLVAIRRMLARLGGTLEISNGEDGGCVVRIWAPLKETGAPQGQEAGTMAAGPGAGVQVGAGTGAGAETQADPGDGLGAVVPAGVEAIAGTEAQANAGTGARADVQPEADGVVESRTEADGVAEAGTLHAAHPGSDRR
ncbi:MAG: GAF domain-containing protein [Bacillota bacterium]